MERVENRELGEIRVTHQPRVYHLSGVCIDGKGNEHAAIRVNEDGASEAYDGEIFRCTGSRMLRVSFPTGTADVRGAVRTADGSSYKDCDGGDALVRTRGGELVCRAKRSMSASAERRLEARNDAADYAYAEDSYEDDLSPGQIDLSGLQLTGGVGN